MNEQRGVKLLCATCGTRFYDLLMKPVCPKCKAEFIIPHCDPSVNLYDKMFCVRGENVEAIWKVAARGMSQ